MRNFFGITIVALALTLTLFRVWQSSGCKSFISHKFKTADVVTAVESQRLYDNDASSLEAKIFNNKFLSAPQVFLLAYLPYLEPKYLLSLVGPLGIMMFFTSIWVVLDKRIKKGFLHLLIVLLTVIFSVYTNPKINNMFMLMSFQSFSFWSVPFFAKNKKRFTCFIIVFVISFLYLFVNWQLPNICSEIFFK